MEAKSVMMNVWMGGGTDDGGSKSGYRASGTGIRNMIRLPRKPGNTLDAPGGDGNEQKICIADGEKMARRRSHVAARRSERLKNFLTRVQPAR